jgi:hypothetical protein
VEDYLKAINTTLGGASGLNKRAFEAPRRLDRLMV